jgi:phosphatidylglycerophosphate synthase
MNAEMIRGKVEAVRNKGLNKARGFFDNVSPYLGTNISERATRPTDHFADGFKTLTAISSYLLDKGFTPNQVTASGAILRGLGSSVMTKPFLVKSQLEDHAGIEISTPKLVALGAVSYGIGLVCDVLDGKMAAMSTGETKAGRVLDGVGDKTAEITGAVLTQIFPEKPEEKNGWKLLPYFSMLSSTIRSSAKEQGIAMGKVDSSSQLGIEGITMFGHLLEVFGSGRAEGQLGAVLTASRVRDCYKRLQVVLQSNDKEAIKNVVQDVVEFSAIYVAGTKITKNPLVPISLGMAKMASVQFREVNNGVGVADIAKKKGVDIFKAARKWTMLPAEFYNR